MTTRSAAAQDESRRPVTQTGRRLSSEAPGGIESMKEFHSPAAIAKVSRGEVSFDLGDLTAPTLLFWGRDDRVSPVDMAIMPMRLMPGVEVHILPNCGHWVMIEQKDAFERQAREFLLRGRDSQ